MIELMINMMGLSCLTWVLTVAEPVLRLRAWLGLLDAEYGVSGFLTRLLTCPMCLGFWVGLIGTCDMRHAAIVSVVARLIDDLMGNVPLT